MRRVKKRKRNEAQRAKSCTPARATDALRREKEQKGKQRKNKKKQGAGPQIGYSGPFGCLLPPA